MGERRGKGEEREGRQGREGVREGRGREGVRRKEGHKKPYQRKVTFNFS